jgi:predicted metal-dependent hydrolase
MNRAIAEAGKKHQTEALYSRLSEIYEQIRRERRIEVFGTLDFEIVRNIDGKKHRIAKLKGNKILVVLNAGRLPKSALKYIIAHEIAHMLTKRHTKRFWKVVEAINPRFETGQNLLAKYGSELKFPD